MGIALWSRRLRRERQRGLGVVLNLIELDESDCVVPFCRRRTLVILFRFVSCRFVVRGLSLSLSLATTSSQL
jgi:hypothetical protein